ncbi:MAG: hypothetical protein JWP97_2934 [Labilithrix sp.]|nr:hypothetical protein [Labilithrix sp.]
MLIARACARLSTFLVPAVLLCSAGAAVVACDNEGPSTIGGPGPGASSSGTPAGQPRSFRTDVIPVLTNTCAVSSCHGDRSGNPGVGIFLPLGDPDGIYADLMKESVEAKGARFVVPRDASKSYLFAKLTGDMSAYVSACGSSGCGQVMPPPPIARLSAAELETVRLWITEGAVDN